MIGNTVHDRCFEGQVWSQEAHDLLPHQPTTIHRIPTALIRTVVVCLFTARASDAPTPRHTSPESLATLRRSRSDGMPVYQTARGTESLGRGAGLSVLDVFRLVLPCLPLHGRRQQAGSLAQSSMIASSTKRGRTAVGQLRWAGVRREQWPRASCMHPPARYNEPLPPPTSGLQAASLRSAVCASATAARVRSGKSHTCWIRAGHHLHNEICREILDHKRFDRAKEVPVQ